MVKLSNLFLGQNPLSVPGSASRIGKRYLSGEQNNGNREKLVQNNRKTQDESSAQCQVLGLRKTLGASDELAGKTQNPAEVLGQNDVFRIGEIAKEVSCIIRSRPRWEETLLSDYPTVDFRQPMVYNEILKQENNALISLRFYNWLRGFNESSFDRASCKVIFRRLVEAGAAKAAKGFLDDTKFEPGPQDLELYIRCLCENGLIDDALEVFERLMVVGHCASMETWNSALSHSVRTKRVDVVWKLYWVMMEYALVADVDTIGHLIRAFCLENNEVKGYELLQQVLQTGHVPKNTVFNTLISSFCKNGKYGKASAVLHNMIGKNRSPDVYTYQEVINGLHGEKMKHERSRIFSELKDRGYFPNRVMYTTMIQSFSKENNIGDARKLWFEMIQKGIIPNEHTYSALMYGLWKSGCTHEAEKLYEEMLSKGYGETSRSYNTMIHGLCLNGKVEQALELFEQMNGKGISGDVIAYCSLVKGLYREGKIIEGRRVFLELLERGLQPSNPSFTMLIEKLCQTGHVEEAEILWQEVRNRGLKLETHSLGPIISGLISLGQIDKATKWFCYRIDNGGRPEKRTSWSLLHCLLGGNRLDDALCVLRYIVKMGFGLKKNTYDLALYKLSQVSLPQVKGQG